MGPFTISQKQYLFHSPDTTSQGIFRSSHISYVYPSHTPLLQLGIQVTSFDHFDAKVIQGLCHLKVNNAESN